MPVLSCITIDCLWNEDIMVFIIINPERPKASIVSLARTFMDVRQELTRTNVGWSQSDEIWFRKWEMEKQDWDDGWTFLILKSHTKLWRKPPSPFVIYDYQPWRIDASFVSPSPSYHISNVSRFVPYIVSGTSGTYKNEIHINCQLKVAPWLFPWMLTYKLDC